MSSVKVDQDGSLAVVTLDRPPMNALDVPMCEEVTEAFTRLGGSDAVDAIVLTSSGAALSAGIDLQILPDLDPPAQDVLLETLNRMYLTIYACPKPVVGAVTGHAIAGGLVFAVCCDHRVVGAKGKHGLSEVAVGVRFPAVTSIAVQAELPVATARRLVLDGTLVRSEEAVALGIYDELSEDPLARATEVARARGAHNSSVYGDLKRVIRADAIAKMEAVLSGGDPLAGDWLSEEMRELARKTLARG